MTSTAAGVSASSNVVQSPLCSLLVERPTFNSLLRSTIFPELEDFVVKFTQNGTSLKAFLKLSGGELRVFLEPVGSLTGEIPSVQAFSVFPLQLLSGIVRDGSSLSLAFAPHTDTIFGFRTGHFREAVLLQEALQLSHNLAAGNHPDCFCRNIPVGSDFINPQKKWWQELEPHYTKPGHDPRRRDRHNRRGTSTAGLELMTMPINDSDDMVLTNNRKRRGTLVNASSVRNLSKCGFVSLTDLSKKPLCFCIPVKPKRYVADLATSTLKLFDSFDMLTRVVKFSFNIMTITNLSCDNGAITMTVNGSLTYLLAADQEDEVREWFSILSEAYITLGGNSSALEGNAVASNSALTVLQLRMQRQQEWFRLTPEAQLSQISEDFQLLFQNSNRQESLESFIYLCPEVTNLAVNLAELLGGSPSLVKAMRLLYDVVQSFLLQIMPGEYGWTKVPLKLLVVLVEWFVDFEQCYETSKVPIPSPGISEIPEFLECMKVCCCNRSGWAMVPREEKGREFSKRWLLLRGRYLQYKTNDDDRRAIETISLSQLSCDPSHSGPLLTLRLLESNEQDIVSAPELNEIKFRFASEDEALSWRDDIIQLRFSLESSESYIPKKPVPALKTKFDEDQSRLAQEIQCEYEKTFTGDEDDIQGIQRCFKVVLEACKEDLDDLVTGDDCEECLKFVLNVYAALIRGTILNWVEYNSDNNFENFEGEDSDPDSQLGLMSEVSTEFFVTIHGYDASIAHKYDVRYDPRICRLISHYVSSKVAKMDILLLRIVEDHWFSFDRDHNGKFENPIKHTVFSFIHQGFLVVRNKTQNHPTALKTFIEECVSSVKRPSALKKVLQNWTSRVFDYLKQDDDSQVRQQLHQDEEAKRAATKEECVQVLCATMNGLFESRMCIAELVDNDELQPFVTTPDSFFVQDANHFLWAELQETISLCKRVENDFKSQCELLRIKNGKPLGGFDEGGCLRLLVDKIAQDLDSLFDVVKLDNPVWLKETRLIEDVISIIEPILLFLKTCFIDQVFRNVLRATFLRVAHLYVGQFLKLKRSLMPQRGEEFAEQIQEATWVMCTRDKEELLSSMLRIQGIAQAKDADIAIFHPMTKISEALSEDHSFFQDTFIELQSFGASLSVAKILLSFKAELSEDERANQLQKLVSSSIEPPPSDDEDESTSSNAPPPFSVFLHKYGHFDRVDPHWKERRDKDRSARLLAKGLNHSEHKFRVPTFDASKVAVETVQHVAASAKQATQGGVNFFDSYIMKAQGLFVGGGRRNRVTLDSNQSVAVAPIVAEYTDIVAVSMDDLFSDDSNSEKVDLVPQLDLIPKKKLAWSGKRRVSTLSAPIGTLSIDAETVSASFAPVLEHDSSASTDFELVVHNASSVLDPVANSQHAHTAQTDVVPGSFSHSDQIDPQANASMTDVVCESQELSASSVSSTSGGLLGLFKESTKKLDSFLSSGSPARPVAAANPSTHSNGSTTHANGDFKQAPADTHDVPVAAAHQTPDSLSVKRETNSDADVTSVAVTTAVPVSSPGGLLGLFKESTKKLDSFLSSGSPARPVAAANASSTQLKSVSKPVLDSSTGNQEIPT
jgi:hypothetical protein